MRALYIPLLCHNEATSLNPLFGLCKLMPLLLKQSTKTRTLVFRYQCAKAGMFMDNGVAQLAGQSLPIPEVHSSNTVIGKIL